MDVAGLAFRLILGFALGAVIGLEREVNQKKVQDPQKPPTALLGLRSFSLGSVLGVIVGILYPIAPGLAILVGSVYFLLLLVVYAYNSMLIKDVGITTELAMIFSFVIGILLSLKQFPIQLTLALTIVVVLLLSQKKTIKNVVHDIKRHEINAFISFAIITLVVLSFLPNISYSLSDIPGAKTFFENLGYGNMKLVALEIINPFKVWLIVVLVIGVDLFGYVLERVIGSKKGWLLASAAGGFVSSTATTQSLAQESKHRERLNPLISSAILANIVSFIQIAFLIGLVNSILLVKLFPVLAGMIISGTIVLLYFLYMDKRASDAQQQDILKNENEKIIDIGAAVKFALLFLVVSILSKVTLALYGNTGFFVATGVGSLIGLDAVMINTATLAGGAINYQIAAFAFVLANAVNLFGKSFYSFMMGKTEFATKFFISMLLIVIGSLLGVLFM